MPTVPTLHLNGTSGKDLWNEYHAAYEAIKTAIDTLCDATSNARDFYPQGRHAYYQHRNERNEALANLRRAHEYVGEVLMGIGDQM